MRRVTLALLAATAAPLVLASCSGEKEGADAIVYCHQFIEDQLRSPSSADFPGNGEHQVDELGEQRWRVSSYVDADNGYGANIRTEWTCEISYEESSETWTLEDLSGL